MLHVSQFTLGQENVSVAPSAPAAAPAPAGAPAGTTSTAAPGAAPAPARQPDAFGGLMLPLLVLVAFVIMMWMGNRRDKKKREETMNSLRKGARVHTLGGLVATVIEVRDNEVVVESSGTRLTFLKSAIATVIDNPEPAKA